MCTKEKCSWVVHEYIEPRQVIVFEPYRKAKAYGLDAAGEVIICESGSHPLLGKKEWCFDE